MSSQGETVWLGDIPVATLRPNGTTVSIYYIHTDPLNTPRQVTRPSDNTPMWTWNSDPFGTDATPNPSGVGTFAKNLRLLGQAFPNFHLFPEEDAATAPTCQPPKTVIPLGWRSDLRTVCGGAR